MLNRCRFLDIALHICGLSGTQCQYMADPLSCPSYDESIDRSYVESYTLKKLTPTEIAQAESVRINEEVESLGEFVKRTTNELRRIGVEAELESVEEKVKEPPDWF